MTNNPAPVDLQWVKARSKCSLAAIFKALEMGVKDDVNEMISLLGDNDRVKITVMPSRTGFCVVREDNNINSISTSSVEFTLGKDEIVVESARRNVVEGVLLTATVTLNNDGDCKLKVKDVELEQWQVRRMALEGLFFRPSNS
ncbi:MAG: hypothetical protein WBQ09_15570 [Terriglobales bacterium]|jgi:hypothetical protein